MPTKQAKWRKPEPLQISNWRCTYGRPDEQEGFSDSCCCKQPVVAVNGFVARYARHAPPGFRKPAQKKPARKEERWTVHRMFREFIKYNGHHAAKAASAKVAKRLVAALNAAGVTL